MTGFIPMYSSAEGGEGGRMRAISPILTGAAIAFGLVAATVDVRAEVEHTIVSLPAENFGFLPFYVAQDAHLFERHELDVKKVVLAGVGTTNGVISGAADFGFSNGA